MAGTRGKYHLYIKEWNKRLPDVYVGEYHYQANIGRLVDITEFGFGIQTRDLVPRASYRIDDVRLSVHPR